MTVSPSLKPPLIFTLLVVAALGFAQDSMRAGSDRNGRVQETEITQPYRGILTIEPKTVLVGKTVSLDLFVTNEKSMAPCEGLAIAAALTMPEMAGMVFEPPKVTQATKAGHYSIQLAVPPDGGYKLTLIVKPKAGSPKTLSFKFAPGSYELGMEQGHPMKDGMPGMADMPMKASYGPWSTNREGSGTTWQTDSSPMFMKMLPSVGGFDFSTMGTLQAGYVNDGGKRGDTGLFSNSMVMVMGRKEVGGGILGLHFMTSLDPFLNGRSGVPNLFQNGFTVHGVDIADRKDPHNAFAELALSYSHPLSREWTGFFYGGPAGEPALGNVMYLHRTSGMEIPEAPISHDWFDGTHISFGVATLGVAFQDKWKLEGSAFNSAEPGETLYGIGKFRLNSASGRLSYNPTQDWSFSTSYGYLNSDVNQHRLTFSAAYSHELPHGDNFSATAYFGQNIVAGASNSNAWLAEATYFHGANRYFARLERVDKNELLGVPAGTYTVNKLLLGDVHQLYSKDGLDYGVGAYAGLYSFPNSLNSSYGASPVTFGIFFRICPSQMRSDATHEMGH